MSINNKLSSLISLLKKAKFVFGKPHKAAVLIYDRTGRENFLLYFDESETETLDVRFESVNIPIAIMTLYNMLSRNKDKTLLRLYVESYIRYVKPKVIITFIDNSLLFMSLKGSFNECVFVSVQNGLRGMVGDVFEYLNNAADSKRKLEVDYALVFGESTANLYKKYIKGRTYSIGSFKNNMLHIESRFKYDVTFVLLFKVKKVNKDYLIKTPTGNKITWDDCYGYNEKILKFLVGYCRNNNLKFNVLGRSKNISVQKMEQQYLDDLKLGEISYLPNSDVYSSYDVLIQNKYTVAIESTLAN